MKKTQQGATLIVVLLILVAMMLMGFALMRSTDLAALISGNSAGKQAATQAGDIGLVAAETQLINTYLSNNGTSVQGYSSTALAVSDDIPQESGSATWSTATAIGTGGLSYQYLIDRQCDSAGNCSTTLEEPSTYTSSLSVQAQKTTTSPVQVQMYRITVKISGPRGLESYVQALYSK